jgi:hypothetical protein
MFFFEWENNTTGEGIKWPADGDQYIYVFTSKDANCCSLLNGNTVTTFESLKGRCIEMDFYEIKTIMNE